mmetsp:Transcript_5894/g.13975  ORF Transcript_5894/g.13975 Transcript_5894/m.13975 type:complete len:203 (-) Transcript_5894:148-756(-)
MLLLAGLVAASCCTASTATADWQDGVQSALLLSAMLPKHGPRPDAQLEAKMQQAGSLVYRAYQLLQAASRSVEVAQEQVRTQTRAKDAVSNLASGEATMERGSAMLRQGQRLQREAEATLQGNADPLGLPPEPPKEWARVGAVAQRAVARERALRGSATEVRHAAQQVGLSLLGVRAQATAVGEDAVARSQDEKLLAFISGY